MRRRKGERIVARLSAVSSRGPAHLNPVAGGRYLANGRAADTCCILYLPSWLATAAPWGDSPETVDMKQRSFTS